MKIAFLRRDSTFLRALTERLEPELAHHDYFL